jgi:hypothetical protein
LPVATAKKVFLLLAFLVETGTREMVLLKSDLAKAWILCILTPLLSVYLSKRAFYCVPYVTFALRYCPDDADGLRRDFSLFSVPIELTLVERCSAVIFLPVLA